jgi:oligopeptide transport system substrate-binding protein
MKRLNLRHLISVFVLLLLFVPALDQPAYAANKVLRIKGREFARFDPQLTGNTAQASTENALFRGLLRYDENGNPAPSIAQEVPTAANGGVSADGKTYTYKLRDWKWSDGNGVVTAQDFVYTFQRLVDPKTGAPYGSFLNGIVLNAAEIRDGKQPLSELGVKAIDAKTLQVSLAKPVSYFNAIASMWIGFAVRKDNVERAGLPKPDAWTDPAYGPVVGSGPFRMAKWDHKNQIVFERNPNFSGTPAKLDQIQFKIIDDEKLAYAAYKNDELDIGGAPATEYETLKADPVMSKEVKQYKAACTNYLAMDNTKPPFNDKKVREAFTYALNRDLRQKVVDQGINAVALSWLPEGVPGYDPELGKQYNFDADKAKKLLADAGFPDGKGLAEVSFSYASSGEGQRTADWYTEQFKQVLNVDIKQNPMDLAAYFATFDDPTTHLPGLFEYGWCADYLHPSNWLYLVFGTGQGNNVVGYTDPEFDKISQQADSELDPKKAMDEYKKAHELLLSDFPVIFINTPTATKLVKPRVTGLKPNALDGGVIGGFFWEDIDLT